MCCHERSMPLFHIKLSISCLRWFLSVTVRIRSAGNPSPGAHLWGGPGSCWRMHSLSKPCEGKFHRGAGCRLTTFVPSCLHKTALVGVLGGGGGGEKSERQLQHPFPGSCKSSPCVCRRRDSRIFHSARHPPQRPSVFLIRSQDPDSWQGRQTNECSMQSQAETDTRSGVYPLVFHFSLHVPHTHTHTLLCISLWPRLQIPSIFYVSLKV